MIGPRTASLGRRLLIGHTFNGQLADVPDPFGAIFRRLDSLPPDERQGTWDAFLDGRPDADAIRSALIGAPVEGPLPEEDAPADDWPPVRLPELPPVEPFPVEVLPGPAADFARVVSGSIGCPVDLVALPCLIVAGAAVGRSASLMLKPGYFASAALYGMNVGGPSSGKSPALDAAVRPLWDIDEALHDDYRRRKAEYEEAAAAYARAKRDERPSRPAPPAIESAVLDDTTVEAVARHLALNPRGLLSVRDEGSAWVASLNQYRNGKGSDRQFWLSALFGKTVRVDRKGNPDLEPIRVPHPFLALAGNLPPDMLSELSDPRGRSDGLIERILFAFPDPRPRPHWSDAGIPEADTKLWAEIVAALRSLPMDAKDGRAYPHVLRFTPEARAEWASWYNANVDETNAPGFDPRELAIDGKLCDFAGRLALILHMIDLAGDPEFSKGRLASVGRTRVRGAIALWRYFRATHRRVRWYMDGGIGNPSARCILDWARRNRRQTFREAELSDDLRWLAARPVEPAAALRWLVECGALRPLPEPPRPEGKRGRSPSPAYEVRPDLLTPRNTGNTINSGH
jgi:hypothetical protein